jgi:D-alanine-D-alanine ligase
MRIGLTYNLKPEGAAGDRYEEFDSLETIEGLERALRSCGHEPVRLGWGDEMLDTLQREYVDGVFNIAEGIGGRGRESQVPAVLELLGIPCSGSDALAIGLTLDKAMAKLIVKSHGIATAPWTILNFGLPISDWPESKIQNPKSKIDFPLFAKPANEGSSMGITSKSLCRTEDELRDAVERLERYGPVLIEEFLPGDEYTVGIIGGEVLGVMQVVPRQHVDDFIYSIDVKRDYLNLVDYKLVDAPDVEEVALAAWRALNLRDVARVDVRRDRYGAANFVEVNPLPGVHPVNSDLVIIARLQGITHEELIARVMRSVEARWSSPPCHPEPAQRGEGPGDFQAVRPTSGSFAVCAAQDDTPMESTRPACERRASRPGATTAARRLLSVQTPDDTLRTALPPSSLAHARDNVAVAYNDDAHLKNHLNATELIGEAEVIETAKEVAELLGATLLPVRDDIPFDDLKRFDVVFNLCEGVQGNPRLEMHFALALEMFGVAHTGGDPIAVGICGDKTLTKRLLRAGGLPSPNGFCVTNDTSRSDTLRQLSALRLPTIVKPSREDAGVGIDAGSVARTADEVIERCTHIHQTYRQPALVEEFIDGQELNQALFFGADGLVLLPPGEVCFAPELLPHERIVGWKAKWDYGSPEDRMTVNRTPAAISDSLRAEIGRICSEAASLLGIRGYCRFDLRRSQAGELFIVDVNPNPDIGAGTGFRKALDAAGISFRDFLNATIIAAQQTR